MKQRGFTIVEVMVAMAIGLVVSAVVVTMFSAGTRTYRVTDAMGELQEAGRIAMSSLQRDAHMVGFRGCNSNNVRNTAPITNIIQSPTAYLNDFANGVRGHDGTAGIWSPGLPLAVSSPGAPVAAGPTANTDVLILRVVTNAPVALSTNMFSTNANIPVMSTTGYVDGTRAIIGDCARATVFQVTAVDAVGNTLQHGSTSSTNITTSVLRSFSQQDAFVMRYETHAYFVGPSVANPGAERSLWLRVDAQPPVEVVDNVQDMQILYGEDTDADFVPNIFRPANLVANWNNVLALQLSMLLRGSGLNDNQAVTNYVYNGLTVTPTDRRLRRVYTATIQLRNRTI